MKLWVDPYRCVGHSLCIAEAPDIFDWDDERGKAVAVGLDVPPELTAQADAAVRICPETAIITIEE